MTRTAPSKPVDSHGSETSPRRVRTSFSHLLMVGTAIAAVVAGPVCPAFAQQAQTPEQRAAAIVSQMTLEEKASQLINTSPAIPRLGLPDYQWWTEALHGVAFDHHATNFPAPIGLAATFNTPLLHSVAEAITVEGRESSDGMFAAGNPLALGSGRTFWSPNLNIYRDPRWGRGQETYGEDPFLTGQMAIAYVTGIQGPDPEHPIAIATPKHFAVHSGPESTRHTADVPASLHDMRDTYFPAFRAALVEGHAQSIMCSYNSLNGAPTCASDFLLTQTVRHDWGFKGVVVSDCGAVRDVYSAHHYATDAATASAAAIRSGLDLECATESIFDRNSFNQSQNYVNAVLQGHLTVADLDRAVTNGLAARIRTGAMDRVAAPAPTRADINSPAHQALALTAAEQAIVLLKNDGVLPLGAGPLRVAVIGPLADAHRVMRSSYTSRETSALASVYDGIRAALPNAQVTLVPAGESVTDGDVVPATALQTEDGSPGVTVKYFPFQPSTGPAPTSLMTKFMGAMQSTPVTTPVATRVEPIINFEEFEQPLLPDGGEIVASGYLVPPVSGTYRVGPRTLVGTFKLGDNPPVSGPPGFNPTLLPTLQTVDLQAGQRYPFTYTMRVPVLNFGELDWQRISRTPEADLTAAAADADVIVAVVGLNSSLESEESSITVPGFHSGDRTTLDLPADQIALLQAAQATGKKLVIVNMSGGAINMDWAKGNANAIVQAWYPGEEGGPAVGRVIAGLANPAGRLPVTFYRSVDQLPAFDQYSMEGRTYRYFQGDPVYQFGYGLSYTTFSYGRVSVRPNGRSTASGVVVEARVTNTGHRQGDEVAQVYLDFPDVPGAPNIALRGFQRISLAPGQSRTVRFELSPRDISAVSPEGVIRVPAGRFNVHVGGGQPTSGLPGSDGTFSVRAAVDLPN